MYLLGYIPRENRVYLGDKELNIVSYSLQLAVLEYQTAIMRKDFDNADKVGGVSVSNSDVVAVALCAVGPTDHPSRPEDESSSLPREARLQATGPRRLHRHRSQVSHMTIT